MRALVIASLAAAGITAVAAAQEQAPEERSLTLRTDERFRTDDRRLPEQPRLWEFAPTTFVEAGVSEFNFTASDAGTQTAGTLRAGVLFNRLFAVEVDYSQLFDAEGLAIPGGSAGGGAGAPIALREPDRVSTAFTRAIWPLGGGLSAHARLGFARIDAENALGDDESASGAAFGAGASVGVGGPAALRLDYTRMQLDELEADVGTVVVSVTF